MLSEGGGNQFVDGFYVAEELKEKDPEAFKLLSTTRIPFTAKGIDIFGEFHTKFARHIIEWVFQKSYNFLTISKNRLVLQYLCQHRIIQRRRPEGKKKDPVFGLCNSKLVVVCLHSANNNTYTVNPLLSPPPPPFSNKSLSNGPTLFRGRKLISPPPPAPSLLSPCPLPLIIIIH